MKQATQHESQISAERRTSFSWTRRLLRFGLFAACLAVILTLLAGFWAQGRLSAAQAAAAEAGIELDPKKLMPPADPNLPNGSYVLGAVADLLSAGPTDPQLEQWKELDLVQAAEDPEQIEDVRQGLTNPTYRLVFETLDLHADVEEANAWLPGQDWSLRVLQSSYANRRSKLFRLRALLKARALIRLADGETTAAYGDAVHLLRVGRWLQTESPSLLSWIVGTRMADIGVQLLEELFQIVPPPPEARALIRAEASLLEELPVSLGLEGELAGAHEEMESGLWFRGATGTFVGDTLPGLFLGWVEDAFSAHWLETGIRLIAEADRPHHERNRFEDVLESKSPLAIPTRMMVPNYLGSLEKADLLHLRLGLLDAALRHLEISEQEGAWPSPNALDLGPDPFSGGALKVRRDDGTWLVYSVGVNGMDDGGGEDDVFWRLPASDPAA